MTHRGQRSHGLSLVEILVALAIIVIGLLAVLRIFPTGLGLVATTSDRNAAVRLSESAIGELRAAESRLPDMLLPAGRPTDVNPGSAGNPNPNFGFPRTRPGSDLERPYDLDLPYQDPGDEPDLLHRLSADERLVLGEQVLVGRSLGVGPLGGARPYHTIFGPVEPEPGGAGTGDVVALRRFRRIDPGELRRTVIGGLYRDRPVFAVVDGGLDDFTQQPAPDRLLFELDSDDRLLIVELAHRDDYGVVRWVKTEPLALPARQPGAANDDRPYLEYDLRDPTSPNPLTRVLPESVRIKQVLGRPGGPFGRFTFDDSGFARGVLYFNAELAGERLELEYVVDDWRNLKEVITVDVNNSGKIVLPGDDLPLSTQRLNANYQPLVVVLSSGQQVPLDGARWDQDHANKGLVPIDSAFLLPAVAGKQELAVFYRREGHWAVVPSLAPLDYTLLYDAYPGTPLNAIVQYAPAGASLDLYFRPSEAGRSVAISYDYLVGAGRRTESGELHVIPPRSNAVLGGEPRCRIRLRRPNVASDTANPARPYVHRIEGRSLRLRVLYDDQQYEREATPSRTLPTPGTQYLLAERLLELGWYVRRDR